MTPPSPWGALINGALMRGFSALAGIIMDGGDGGFWEGEPGLSPGRREVFQWGDSNLSDSKPWMGGEEG